jgi:hypothetical protein
MPGVGPVLCVALLSDLPELGRLNRQEIAALAGAASFNCDSGTLHGRRKIQGGRERLRRSCTQLRLLPCGAIPCCDPSISVCVPQVNRPRWGWSPQRTSCFSFSMRY